MMDGIWTLAVNFINFLNYHTPLFYLTQSVWRDEAFSYFMAKPNVFSIIINTANDFNPPLYYLLLHFWTYISGNSDTLLRILSFTFHILGTYYALLLGRKLAGKKAAFYLALFYFLNPMLIYYAFEIRMYSLYALTATAAVYYFYIKNWKLYTISSIAGLYSHSFFALVVFSFGLYSFVKHKFNKELMRTLFPILFFIPWIPVLAIQFSKSKESWLFPADWQLIKSVLGNLFTNYEGTPGHLWQYTAILSITIIIFLFLCFKNKKLKGEIFIYPIIIPLFLILFYSIFKRPIYVNRYMIFISVFEVIAVYVGIISIKNLKLRKIFSALWILFIVFFNLYIPSYKKKTDFKATFSEINKKAENGDFVYAKTPIGFLESVYYYKEPKNTYVYNPQNIHIPSYIGVSVIFPDVSKETFPPAPSRTFIVNDDASFEIIIQK